MMNELRAIRRAGRRLMMFGVVATLAIVPPAFARAAQAPSEPAMVPLTPPGVSPEISFQIHPQADTFAFLIAVDSAAGCKYPLTFAMQVQLDGAVSQKRGARFSQELLPDGSCIEVLATVFTRAEFLPVARARRIELTLPSGAILLPQATIDYVRSFLGPAPITRAEAVPPVRAADEFTSLSREVLRLVAEQRYAEAVPPAERAVGASEGRPMADRIMALSNGAYVKRRAGDQTGAAAAYERAVALADAAGYEAADLGIVLDNLARLRTDNKEYASAETISLRALSILRRTLGEQHASLRPCVEQSRPDVSQ